MNEVKRSGESKTQHLEVILEFGHSSTLRDVPKVCWRRGITLLPTGSLFRRPESLKRPNPLCGSILGLLYKGSHPERKAAYFWTLSKSGLDPPLTPPHPFWTSLG